MTKKLFTLLLTIFIGNSYAIDIKDIDIGDGYYAILGSGQTIWDNFSWQKLSISEANTIKNAIKKVIIVRINKSDNLVKIRLNDSSVDWCNVKYLLTNNEMRNIQSNLNTFIEEERERNRKYCCCHTTMTNFWGMEFKRKIWVKTKQCINGWKSYTELGGGQVNAPGTCTEYSSYDSGSCR